MQRRGIIHVDMDAFYAAVEQRDNPELRGLPVAVGGREGRGVVATASYEARTFGVRSAMPAGEALRRCPQLIFVRPRFDAYREVSGQIRAIFGRHTELVEPLSLDEAYLDVSHVADEPLAAAEIAKSIKRAILAETGLTASAGVSFNKFLAKTASAMNKPDGLTLVTEADAMALLARLPVEDFHGVGPRTAEKLRQVGITCGADLQAAAAPWLERMLGKGGTWLWRISRGQDDRLVEPDRPRRSLSVEETYARDLVGRAAMVEALRPLATELTHRLSQSDFRGRSLVLKIRTAAFITSSRQAPFRLFPQDEDSMWTNAVRLLDRPGPPPEPVRLLGLGIADGGHVQDRRQMDLFAGR